MTNVYIYDVCSSTYITLIEFDWYIEHKKLITVPIYQIN